MRRMHCPYCYERIHRPLSFQCRGLAAPGSPGCQPSRDPRREELTGFSAPTYPVFRSPGNALWSPRRARCSDCGGLTGIRACPACHTPLPANFGDADGPMIAMFGATGTGKTAYLTVLANDVRHNMGERFQADIRLTATRQGGENSPVAWLENNVERLFRDQQLAPKTPAARNGRQEPLVFEWRAQRWERLPFLSGYRTTYLSFYDTAGEDAETDSRRLKYLSAARALILLLDPFMLPAARDLDLHDLPDAAIQSDRQTIEIVTEVTNMLRECHGVSAQRKIKVPIAVAFPKMDAFFQRLDPGSPIRTAPRSTDRYDEAAGVTTHEYMRSLLLRWKGFNIDKTFIDNYRTYRYFAVSALGRPPNYLTGSVHDGGVRPHRIDEPLLWLLHRLKVVDRR